MSLVCWTVSISEETDETVHAFLATRGKSRYKGDLSRFVEEAICAYLVDRPVYRARVPTKKPRPRISDQDLDTLVDEAMEWARKH